MLVEIADFNGADALFAGRLSAHWREIRSVLEALPPHLKASDQAGIQGALIFDPVGTNFGIKAGLAPLGWNPNVRMPEAFKFLGTDVDFVKDNVLVEVQFSNYPFLLNNSVRAELLHKSRSEMSGSAIDALVVITKGRMFPASNSTLYYEQGLQQLSELSRNSVLDIPIRLVGLFSDVGESDASFTTYHAPRYSRTIVEQIKRKVMIENVRGRCRITLV